MMPTLNLLFHLHHETEEERPSARAYAEVLDLILAADQLPIGCAWLAEHHLLPTRGRLPAPLLMAVAAARDTRRIRVGPCVLLAPLHAPLDLAEQIAVADLLSQGRLAVGLGSGGSPEEFAAFGVPIEERRERFTEGVSLITSALTGDPFSFDGRYYQAPEVTLTPHPVQPVNDMVWLAAMSAISAELAGRHGCHLLLARGVRRVHLREQIAAYRAARAAHGFDPAHGRIQVTRGLYVAPTDEQAWHEAANGIAGYIRQSGQTAASQDIQDLARQGDFIIGSPETCAAAIRDLATAVPITDLACDISLFGMDYALTARSLDLLGSAVAPLLLR